MQQISILEWFQKHYKTEDWSNGWKTAGVMDKNSVLLSGINYIWRYIKIETNSFKL